MRQRNTISDFLDSFFNNDFYPYVASSSTTASSTKPAMNVLETDDVYRIELATPGLSKEDIGIKLDEEENLVVSFDKSEKKTTEAPREEQHSERNEVAVADAKPVRYLRREIMLQSFVQKLRLPDDANKERISATMENGLLLIEIPKVKEEERAKLERRISIQ